MSSQTYNKSSSKLTEAIRLAKEKIATADRNGHAILKALAKDRRGSVTSARNQTVVSDYREAFAACAKVRDIDKLAFHADWFSSFYKRNYDALMVKSLFDNIVDDADNVRFW